jgi:hypothetical protein
MKESSDLSLLFKTLVLIAEGVGHRLRAAKVCLAEVDITNLLIPVRNLNHNNNGSVRKLMIVF